MRCSPNLTWHARPSTNRRIPCHSPSHTLHPNNTEKFEVLLSFDSLMIIYSVPPATPSPPGCHLPFLLSTSRALPRWISDTLFQGSSPCSSRLVPFSFFLECPHVHFLHYLIITWLLPISLNRPWMFEEAGSGFPQLDGLDLSQLDDPSGNPQVLYKWALIGIFLYRNDSFHTTSRGMY